MVKYSKQLGVKKRPYDLRHTFALLYLKNGGYELSLQRTLGNTTLEMTKRYCKCQYQNEQKIENKNVQKINLALLVCVVKKRGEFRTPPPQL